MQGLQAFSFCVVAVNDELTVQKKVQGLNLKMAYASNSVWRSGLKATGSFVILLSQDGFESECPETKFRTITS